MKRYIIALVLGMILVVSANAQKKVDTKGLPYVDPRSQKANIGHHFCRYAWDTDKVIGWTTQERNDSVFVELKSVGKRIFKEVRTVVDTVPVYKKHYERCLGLYISVTSGIGYSLSDEKLASFGKFEIGSQRGWGRIGMEIGYRHIGEERYIKEKADVTEIEGKYMPSLMANIYKDFGRHKKLNLYLMCGAGFTWTKDINNLNPKDNDTTPTFSWQAGFGGSTRVCHNIHVDLGLRAVSVHTTKCNSTNAELTIGLRYKW